MSTTRPDRVCVRNMSAVTCAFGANINAPLSEKPQRGAFIPSFEPTSSANDIHFWKMDASRMQAKFSKRSATFFFASEARWTDVARGRMRSISDPTLAESNHTPARDAYRARCSCSASLRTRCGPIRGRLRGAAEPIHQWRIR